MPPTEQLPERPHRPEKVRVRVRRDTHGNYTATSTSGHPMPPVAASVIPFLSRDDQAQARIYHYSGMAVNTLISQTITHIKPRAWSMAIAKCIATRFQQEREVETELLCVAGGGFLAIGNVLFKLDAVDYIATTKALPALRSNVREEMKREEAQIIEGARAQAEEIANAARNEARVVQEEISNARAERDGLLGEVGSIPPQWVRQNAIPYRHSPHSSYMGHVWQIGFLIPVQLKTFVWTHHARNGSPTRQQINGVPGTPLRMLVWTELVRVNEGGIKLILDGAFKSHPHVSTASSCLITADIPTAIDSYAAYQRTYTALTRSMSEFNMDSPLRGYHEWEEDLKKFVPDNLRPIFNTWARNRGVLSAILAATPDLIATPLTDAAVFNTDAEEVSSENDY